MKQPSGDEIQRVAAYWQWVKAVTCKHQEITFTVGEVVCSECSRPVKMLSDIQIENIRNPQEGQ